MTIKDISFVIADLVEASFVILEKLGNIPNDLFILLGLAGMFWWLFKMVKYKQEAAVNRTLK